MYIKVQALLASALLDLLSVSGGCFFTVNSTNLTSLGVTFALQDAAKYKVTHENDKLFVKSLFPSVRLILTS